MRPFDPRLRPFLRPGRGPLAVVVLGGLLGGLLTLAQAFAVGTLVVRLVSEPGSDAWHAAGWWTVALVAARTVTSYAVARRWRPSTQRTPTASAGSRSRR